MRTAVVALAVALAAAVPAAAQPRPKVCLVLSGGGARGAAHVGVLKVLEELRVPVDCIAGTSMGSIVGAAYASGTTVEQMNDIVASLNSRLLFHELPPREERSARLKKDDATLLAPMEIGLRGSDLLLPKGLVSGVQMESVLRRLSRVHGLVDFDHLPIPYRAVATDLVTGKAVVLSRGELAVAMRASMSVPAAVEPVRVEGKLLVDGGLTNNLPVDVARAMGADVVIAVNLGTPLIKAENLTSVIGVTGQMVNILTEQNVQASLAALKPSDVLILPQLGDFSAADFDHLQVVVPLGESAARVATDKLSKLSLPPAEYARWQARRTARPEVQPLPVDEIRFENLAYVNPETARSVLDTQVDQPIDPKALDDDMRRLYGTGDFEHVGYRFLEEPGRRVLAIDAVEKSWGPGYLQFGLGLSTDFRGDAFFNLMGRYRRTWLNSLGGEWSTELQAGRTNRLQTSFYQPLEATQTWFVEPMLGYERRNIDVYDGGQRVASYDVRTAAIGIDLGRQFTRYGEIRLGIERFSEKYKLDTGPAAFQPEPDSGAYSALSLRGGVDRLDSMNFPRSGYMASVKVLSSPSGLGGDIDFTRAEASGTYATSFGENTVNLSFKLGQRIGDDPLPASRYFHWGGLLQQSGYPTGALIGEDMRFARLAVYRRIADFSLLEGAYGGLSLEYGRVTRPLVPDNEQGWLRSFALVIGTDTPIGPLYVGYGRVDRGLDSMYLFLGRP